MCMTRARENVFLDGEKKRNYIVSIYVHRHIRMHVHDTRN